MNRVALAVLCVLVVACHRNKKLAPAARPDPWQIELQALFAREPDSTPSRWKWLIHEYGPDTLKRWYVLERDKRLWIMDQFKNYSPLAEKNDTVFNAPVMPLPISGEVRFHLDSNGYAASVQVGDLVMPKRYEVPSPGIAQLRITPVRPIDELRREALALTPPAETGSVQPTHLVEITPLDSTIRLEIRYATENNFLGVKLYDTARAFMQKPAAEALVRANKSLRRLGYGLLVHDAYRPWYVTKIFWDATPADRQWMVANPTVGSRHNRGIAVDITLYDFESKKPVEMPSTYDESTVRAYSTYPGGTSLQRHYRLLLRRVLEHEGFAVNPLEWWHFDYIDRKHYAIGNVAFDAIPVTPRESAGGREPQRPLPPR
jgi:D-alanyl-D-alanine dipeptidase